MKIRFNPVSGLAAWHSLFKLLVNTVHSIHSHFDQAVVQDCAQLVFELPKTETKQPLLSSTEIYILEVNVTLFLGSTQTNIFIVDKVFKILKKLVKYYCQI